MNAPNSLFPMYFVTFSFNLLFPNLYSNAPILHHFMSYSTFYFSIFKQQNKFNERKKEVAIHTYNNGISNYSISLLYR